MIYFNIKFLSLQAIQNHKILVKITVCFMYSQMAVNFLIENLEFILKQIDPVSYKIVTVI